MRLSTLIARNILRRSVRSLLTVLGISIGIAAVVALLGIARGFERSFLAIYDAKGIDLVVVRAGVSDKLTSNLDASLAAKIKKIEGVREVGYSLLDAIRFEEAHVESALLNGWEPRSLLFRGIRLLKGRSLDASDDRAAMLGRVLALNLGKSVGDVLDVAGEPFRVVGLFESDSLFENGGLIVPIKTLRKMMGREGQVTGFVITTDKPGDKAAIEAVGRRIEAGFPGVAATPARDYVSADVQIRLVQAMAWTTSVIALILGSVGMLNTMLMAVFERTREIGILRALGWKRRRVLGLVLGESVVLGIVGGVFGTILGVVSVRALQLSPTARGFISPEMPAGLLGVGLALGTLLSLLGGLYPALRGASLDPTEALRHD